MNELSTDIKTHVILTFAGTHHPITSQQNEKLKTAGEKDVVDVDGATIKISSISVVMSLEEYYREFPAKRPSYETLPVWKEPREEYVSIEEQARRSKAHSRGLLEGLKKYCDAGGGKGAKLLYAAKLEAYKRSYAPSV